MAVIKIIDKDALDKLIATLTLRLGKKIHQQDVIDACIKLSSIHLDELEGYFTDKKVLTKKKVEEILKLSEDFDFETKGSIDADIYGEK